MDVSGHREAFDACPSQAEITGISTSCRCMSVPHVCRASSNRMWRTPAGFEDPRPQSVRTKCPACLVYNHVAAGFVKFAERQTVGGLDGPGGPQCGGEVVGSRKCSPSRSRLRSLF